tara:strand:- start:677 stop:1600 length:924 start_codon:yes stop_codon:yes gene_type:complete
MTLLPKDVFFAFSFDATGFSPATRDEIEILLLDSVPEDAQRVYKRFRETAKGFTSGKVKGFVAGELPNNKAVGLLMLDFDTSLFLEAFNEGMKTAGIRMQPAGEFNGYQLWNGVNSEGVGKAVSVLDESRIAIAEDPETLQLLLQSISGEAPTLVDNPRMYELLSKLPPTGQFKIVGHPDDPDVKSLSLGLEFGDVATTAQIFVHMAEVPTGENRVILDNFESTRGTLASVIAVQARQELSDAFPRPVLDQSIKLLSEIIRNMKLKHHGKALSIHTSVNSTVSDFFGWLRVVAMARSVSDAVRDGVQ